MFNLAELLVFPLFLVFVRMGTCLMVMPGFSDMAVNVRARLLLAFVVSLAMFPLLEPSLPALPESLPTTLMYLFVEMAVGLMMGISARIFMATMHVAGEMVAFTSGLQASTLFDPTSGAQTTAPALFLLMVATVLIFVTNLHHLLIEGVAESYIYFEPGNMPDSGDALQAVTNVVRDIFIVGLKIAAPIMVVGFLGYVGFGIFNRLIPQMQVFFVALPITILVGLFILGISMGSIVLLFSQELANHAILFMQDE